MLKGWMAILRTANNIDIIEQIKDFRPFDLFDKPSKYPTKEKEKNIAMGPKYIPQSKI